MKNKRQTMRPTPPMRPTVGDAVTPVRHPYLAQGPFYSRAGGEGAGEPDAGSARSRTSRPDEVGEGRVEKRQDTPGSRGGEQVAGGVAYSEARLRLRPLGVFMPVLSGTEDSDAMIRLLHQALVEAAASNRKKNQTRADLAGWSPGQNQRALRGWAATDLSLGGGLSLDEAQDAALQQLDAAGMLGRPRLGKKTRLRMSRAAGTSAPAGFTKARARECALEQLRSAGLI
jgi:hypothetical protein